MTSYEETLQNGIQHLNTHGIENANIDAWYLLSHLCGGMSRTEYFLCKKDRIPEQLIKQYQQLLGRRVEHEPVQYIIGKQDFMGLTFLVDTNVLIPRQDTEILVELALSLCQGKRVLDVCTGSGCIAISIAKLGKPSYVSALDISSKALDIAKKNGIEHEVAVDFFESDMFQGVKQTYDIIVSNPPYIKRGEIKTLMPEVKEHEPMIALDGKEDGLEFYRILTNQARNYLNPGGKVIVEIGYDQAKAVCDLFQENGYYNIEIKKDYSNLDRVVSASMN